MTNVNPTGDAMLGTLEFDNGQPINRYGEEQEKHVIPSFFKKQVLHPLKSKAAGEPVYIERDYVRIEIVGGRDVLIAPANDKHKMRFPKTWSLYAQGESPEEGIPLEQLPGMDADTIARYRGLFHCGTVEALAAVSDAGLMHLGVGARDFQKIAKMFLNEKGQKVDSDVTRIEKLEEKLAKTTAALETLKNPPTKKSRTKRKT